MGFTFEQSSNKINFSNGKDIYKVFTIKNRKNRRDLSKFLKLIQFNCYIKVKLHTFPKVIDYDRFRYYDPYNTIRCDVVEMVRRLSFENYLVVAEVFAKHDEM